MHLGAGSLIAAVQFPGWRNLSAAILLLGAMIGAGVLGLRSFLAVAVLFMLSLAWLTVDKMFEFATILDLTHNHGIVISDLVGFAGLLASFGLALRRLLSSP